jgi:hypothetical protein
LLLYQPKSGHELDDDALTDPLEFLARVLTHIPQPNRHLVHFYGAYANRVRRTYRDQIRTEDEAKPIPSCRAANKRWAELIYRIYQVDPLTCPQCGGEMKILAFITDPGTIRTILDHREKIAAEPRAPPDVSSN